MELTKYAVRGDGSEASGAIEFIAPDDGDRKVFDIDYSEQFDDFRRGIELKLVNRGNGKEKVICEWQSTHGTGSGRHCLRYDDPNGKHYEYQAPLHLFRKDPYIQYMDQIIKAIHEAGKRV